MVGNPKWRAGLIYVDLFAGPGICKLEGSGRRIPGSVLIAANSPKHFRAILASEMDKKNADALEARLAKSPANNASTVFRGDCNDRIKDIIARIPARALTLAFIDPENLRIKFSTVQTLASAGRVDLLVLLADRMDIVRNVATYEKQKESVLDRMLGPHSTWREKWRNLANRSASNICRLFSQEYQSQLEQQLGYKAFGETEIVSAKGPLYRLIYASKNDRGLDFWNKVTQKEHGGQMGLQF